MARALRLARKGLGRTDPNPMVGAVIVKRGRVVGEGFHRAPGKPHAEVEAIRDAGTRTQGSELYVTLEPCNHHGRTPPCTEVIRKSGISAVWFGMADPNPGVKGGGAEALTRAGLQVRGPVLEDRCKRLNEVYLTNVTLGRAFVFLKLGMSLDGRIATRTGHSRWITSEASRRQVHRLRDRVAGVMIGIGTALADNPSLTTRLPRGSGRDAERIIVDSSLRTPPDSKIMNPSSPAGVIIACRAKPPAQRRKRLEQAGARVLPTSGSKRVDLPDLLSQVYGLGITSILIEGGSELAWGALNAKIVDRCLFYYAPIMIGGQDAPSGISGTGIDKLEQAPRLTDVEVSRVGPDMLVSGRVSHQGS